MGEIGKWQKRKGVKREKSKVGAVEKTEKGRNGKGRIRKGPDKKARHKKGANWEWVKLIRGEREKDEMAKWRIKQIGTK